MKKYIAKGARYALFGIGFLCAGAILGVIIFGGNQSPSPTPQPAEPVSQASVSESPEQPDPETELDEFGNPIPQRVKVDIGKYPTEPDSCSTLTLPRTNPFCDNLSDRALTDTHIANYMAHQVTYKVAPNSLGAQDVGKDALHWLRQVVATPAEEGGPQAEHREQYLEVLDRWLSDDYSQIDHEAEFVRGVLGW